jgi:predicted SprT family Zn-dependent metalloprotease
MPIKTPTPKYNGRRFRSSDTPTAATYEMLDEAFEFFNVELFDGQLGCVLITLQRKSKCGGYCARDRFGRGEVVVDEIALNPSTFEKYGFDFVLSVLVHEMAHSWQYKFGKPSRGGYHNKEWASKMKAIGLHPSSTGKPGGKETGPKMAHYITEGGAFAASLAAFKKRVDCSLFVELWTEEKKTAKAKNKTKYECPDCEANIWGKPSMRVLCLDCDCEYLEVVQ